MSCAVDTHPTKIFCNQSLNWPNELVSMGTSLFCTIDAIDTHTTNDSLRVGQMRIWRLGRMRFHGTSKNWNNFELFTLFCLNPIVLIEKTLLEGSVQLDVTKPNFSTLCWMHVSWWEKFKYYKFEFEILRSHKFRDLVKNIYKIGTFMLP